MGRKAEGWKCSWRGGVAYVRFTYAGQPYFFSTGERDSGKAPAACAREYARVVEQGVARKRTSVALSRESLVMLFARWVESLEGILDEKTVTTYEGYARGHFVPAFPELRDALDLGNVRRYIGAGLRRALRSTVQKEIGALRGFLTWCRDEGLIGELPEWALAPSRLLFPAKAKGTRTGKQRAKANELSPAQVEAFLAALPELGGRGSSRFPVRDRFVVAYETGLRPATIALVTKRHVQWDAMVLAIPDDEDKARFGRTVPLSARAIVALGRAAQYVTMLDTPIFGRHDYREVIYKAAKLAGLGHLRIAPYDLRHARATHLTDAGAPRTALMHLHGWTQASTGDKYVHGSEREARKWVDAKASFTRGSLPVTRGSAEEEGRHPPRDTVAGAVPREAGALPPVVAETAEGTARGKAVESAPGTTHPRTKSGVTPGRDPDFSRSIPVQSCPVVVRRTGVEPVQELPRWNLNPTGCDDTSGKQACHGEAARHSSSSLRTVAHRSRALHVNPSEALRRVFRGASRDWFQRSDLARAGAVVQ